MCVFGARFRTHAPSHYSAYEGRLVTSMCVCGWMMEEKLKRMMPFIFRQSIKVPPEGVLWSAAGGVDASDPSDAAGPAATMNSARKQDRGRRNSR